MRAFVLSVVLVTFGCYSNEDAAARDIARAHRWQTMYVPVISAACTPEHTQLECEQTTFEVKRAFVEDERAIEEAGLAARRDEQERFQRALRAFTGADRNRRVCRSTGRNEVTCEDR